MNLVYEFHMETVRSSDESLEALVGAQEAGWEWFQTIPLLMESSGISAGGVTLYFRRPLINNQHRNGTPRFVTSQLVAKGAKKR